MRLSKCAWINGRYCQNVVCTVYTYTIRRPFKHAPNFTTHTHTCSLEFVMTMCVFVFFSSSFCDLFARLTRFAAQNGMTLSQFDGTFLLVYLNILTLVWADASFVVHGGDVTCSVFLTIYSMVSLPSQVWKMRELIYWARKLIKVFLKSSLFAR